MLRAAVRVVVAVGVLAVAAVAWGRPELSIARGMLAALPAAERSLREAAVESTLSRMPGAGETFLSALMSWGYLTGGWSDPGLGGQPYLPAEGSVYNNRQWGAQYSMPVTVAVGSASFRSSGLLFTSPLILDLGGDGTPDVSGGAWEPHAGMDLNDPWVMFDIDGDGFPDLTEWVGPSDGLLVAPENADATWTGPVSGRDLLGSAGGYRDGFEKLAHRFDADHDGIVSGSELDGLYVWRDLNQNATIEPGELVRPEDLFITALHLPAAGTAVGSFANASGQSAMWDWWPSYLQGYRVWAPGTTAPPTSVPVVDVPQPDLAFTGPPLLCGADGSIDGAILAAAGLDFQTVRLVGLSPAGSWLVWHDRMPGVGVARRLWILPAAGVTPRIVPVPAADILQFVFADDGNAFLVTDNGSSLLKLDLATGALTQVYGRIDGAAGLRFGGRAFRGPGGVFFSGRFHSADLASQHDAIVSWTGAATLVEAADHDLLLAGVEHLGVVAGEFPVGPNFTHFVVRTPSAESLLVVSRDGVLVVADDNVLPNGLAASGDRVLYFRQTADQTAPEVRVFDAQTGKIIVLGAGDYCYPYLTGEGTVACVASIDWPAMTMTIWTADVVPGGQLQSRLVADGIGTVRVSEDGQDLVFLGREGLQRRSLVATDVASEVVRPLQLSQNRPNPFNPRTTFTYSLPKSGRVVLAIYDVRGSRVATLVDADLPAGDHHEPWGGLDARGMSVPSGIYFARLETPEGRLTVKVTLAR